MAFKDHFSGHAQDYSRYRPRYPDALYDWLAERCRDHDLAWDCATGNGQAAIGLSRHFKRVEATDASAEQLANATAHPGVKYRLASAEKSGLEPDSADLVTVAQAVHWFDQPRFFSEARRVLKPGGLLAIWAYQLTTVKPAVDAVVAHLYTDITGPFWPPERVQIENGYRDLAFPFTEIAPPALQMQASWRLEEFLGYLGTWSGLRRYQARFGENPLRRVEADLLRAWGGVDKVRRVAWPLLVRAGYLDAEAA